MNRLTQTEDRLTLAELFRSSGSLDPYVLHKQYELSPGQIYSAISKLQQLGIAHFDGSSITLTEYGYLFSVANAHLIWDKVDRRAWLKTLPDKYASLPAPSGIYYCPRRFSKEYNEQAQLSGDV
jgi:hypothetical protein